MKWLIRLLGTVLVLALLSGIVAWWVFNDRPSLVPYEAMLMPAVPNSASGVRVQWLGVATVLIDDGETAILTDGFFSRPDRVQLATGKIAPDLDAIDKGMKRAGITKLAAVIVNHSHYDHAMDAPEVARRTGAQLIGSESTANVGRGWGLPESQIVPARVGEPMTFDRFAVTLLPSQHSPTGFTGGAITQPLKPPARFDAYLEGASYAVLIQHESHSMLINASAGFEPGALASVRADVVMLGVGSLGVREPSFQAAYWQNVVSAVSAKRIIAIHWDDFMLPAGTPPVPAPRMFSGFDETMQSLIQRGKRDGVDVRLPRAYEPMDVWAGLPGAH